MGRRSRRQSTGRRSALPGSSLHCARKYSPVPLYESTRRRRSVDGSSTRVDAVDAVVDAVDARRRRGVPFFSDAAKSFTESTTEKQV